MMLYRPTRAYDALISMFCEINAVKVDPVVGFLLALTYFKYTEGDGDDDGVFTHAQGDIECHECRYDDAFLFI